MSDGTSTDYLVDLHCHFMPPDLPDLAAELGDPRWPHLTVRNGEETGRVMLGDELFRVVQRPCWDMDARIRAMDKDGVDVHVMSPIPVGLTYWGDLDHSVVYSRHMNDWLAEQVQSSGGRLKGLATVPLQESAAAIKEMRRAVETLGLSGVEIGTIVNGQELSAPFLRPFFREANDLGVPLFVHPMARYHGYAMDRCSGALESGGIEMTTDTTLAVTALVFGGVMEECPDLRLCLSHGGGTFTWAYPRLRQAATRGALDVTEAARILDERVASIYVDSLVNDAGNIGLLRHRYRVGHIVAGSDYPFANTNPGQILDEGVELKFCSADEARQIKGPNALAFLNVTS